MMIIYKKQVILLGLVLALAILPYTASAEVFEVSNSCGIDECEIELEGFELLGYTEENIRDFMTLKQSFSMGKPIPNTIIFDEFELENDKLKIKLSIKPATQNYFGIEEIYNSSWANSSLPYAQNVSFLNVRQNLTNCTLFINFSQDIFNYSQDTNCYDVFPYSLTDYALPYYLVFCDKTVNNSLMIVTTDDECVLNENVTITFFTGNETYNTSNNDEDVFSYNPRYDSFWYFKDENTTVVDWAGSIDLSRTGDKWNEVDGFFGTSSPSINATSDSPSAFYDTSAITQENNKTIGLLANTYNRDNTHNVPWSHGDSAGAWAVGENHNIWYGASTFSGAFGSTLHNGGIRDIYNTSHTYSINAWYLAISIFGDASNPSNISINHEVFSTTNQNQYLTTEIYQDFYWFSAYGTEGSGTSSGFPGIIQFGFYSEEIWQDTERLFLWDTLFDGNYTWDGVIVNESLIPAVPPEMNITYTSYYCSGNNSIMNITTNISGVITYEYEAIVCVNGCNENNLIITILNSEPNLCNPNEWLSWLLFLAVVVVIIAIINRFVR